MADFPIFYWFVLPFILLFGVAALVPMVVTFWRPKWADPRLVGVAIGLLAVLFMPFPSLRELSSVSFLMLLYGSFGAIVGHIVRPAAPDSHG